MKLPASLLLTSLLRGARSSELRGGAVAPARRLQDSTFSWHPYLIVDHLAGSRPLSVTVLWRATSATCGICWWLADSSCGGSTTVSRGTGPQDSDGYKYVVTGASFDATYEYSVTCGSDTLSGSFVTPPDAPSTGSPETVTKVVAYGDSRSDPGMHDLVAERVLYNLDNTKSDWYGAMLMHVGDYVYEGECFNDWVTDMMDKAYPKTRELMRNTPINGARGNHETGASCQAGSPWWSVFQNVFPHPFQAVSASTDYATYSVDYGNIHTVVVDQYYGGTYDTTSDKYSFCANDPGDASDCTACSDHFEWIKADLQAANGRDVVPFKFVLIHEPLWSMGGGHSNEVEPCFDKLLVDEEVEVVFAGHNHYYARAERMNMSTGSRTYHITTGGGGYCCHNPQLATNWEYTRKGVSDNHYSRVDARTFADGSKYLCLEAIDDTGSMIDFFEIGNRPASYPYCKCKNNLSCSDSRNCNGVEVCNLGTGVCEPASSFPCGTDSFCEETSSGYVCGCDGVSAGACADAAPFCGVPTKNGKVKCTDDQSLTNDVISAPVGDESTAAYCSDGTDNDFDGLTDCEDPGCEAFCFPSGPTTSAPTSSPTRSASPSVSVAPVGGPTGSPTKAPVPSSSCLARWVLLPTNTCIGGFDTRCCSGECWDKGGNQDYCK